MKQFFDKILLNTLSNKALGLRIDSLRATTAALSGHPTSCLSAADILAVLFFHVLRYDYNNPLSLDNDRFILSKGHAIAVVYAALYQLGVITDEQLLSYRKIDSEFEGHPTPRFIHNQAATGSLGQGLSIGLGMALQARYDKRGCRTYVMLGDAEIAEGSVWEAAELAAYYKVNSLIAFIDGNRFGQSEKSLHGHDVERIAQKFEAFGWQSFVIDGHNIEEILITIEKANTIGDRPSVIVAKTIKGYGLDGIEDKQGFHGKPFTNEELPLMIEKLQHRFGLYVHQSIDSNALLDSVIDKKISLISLNDLNIEQDKNAVVFIKGKKISTRKAFGYALAALGKINDTVFVLDADVKNSTFTDMFEFEYPDRFIQCFIAEQNMIGVATGLAQRGKTVFAATFASFFSRCYDQIRMAGVGRVSLRLCGSHSGISIGQDGPSQMGLEDLALMRAIHGSVVLWPSDGVSTYKLVEQMACYFDGVSYIKTVRSDLPILYELDEQFLLGGCKVLRQSESDQCCLISAGVTLHEALKAYELLKQQGILVAVIDLYSIKPLDKKTIVAIAQRSKNKVITIEDHYQEGGLGEAVSVALSGTGINVFIRAVSQLPRSGTQQDLYAMMGIDVHGIISMVKTVIK